MWLPGLPDGVFSGAGATPKALEKGQAEEAVADVIYLALGVGGLLVFAGYAAFLTRV
jgi:hypothetical protein